MKLQPYYKWILLFLFCCCVFVLGAILSPNIPFLRTEPTDVTSTQIAHPSSTIVVVTSSSSYTDPSSVIAFLGVFVAAVSLAFVIKYVRDTAAMAKATRDSADATRDAAKAADNTLQEMRNARDEENAPFVVVYLHYIHSQYRSIYLVVENVGKSIATDIRLEFSPALQVSEFNRKELEANTLLKDGIKSLVPNYKLFVTFDHLIHYLHGDFPIVYTVKVSYLGKKTLPPQILEYSLDLSYFKHISFVTEIGLGEIDQTLQHIAENINSSHLDQMDKTNNALEQIANSIRGGVFIKNDVSVHLQNEDIFTILNEVVVLWVVGYGKQAEKWNRTFMSDLRAKYSLIGNKLLKNSIFFEVSESTEALHSVISQILTLASIQISLDAIDGVISSTHIAMIGIHKEQFDELGDNIATKVKMLIKIIEKDKQTLLNENTEQDTHSPNNAKSD